MSRRERDAEGAMWREFGLRNALAHMPANSPGRPVVEALLARGTLTPDEGRRFKAQGLRAALANMPADSPGGVVVQSLLDSELRQGQPHSMGTAEGVAPQNPSKETRGSDVLDALERLVALREKGHLTDREFEAAKRKLLD
jgi:hypothetical protein